MAQLFSPHFQAVDADGVPISGAKLFFYLAGTTTPTTTYQDAAATTPHTNPVIADSAGLFAPIFLDLAVTFKVVLKDADGITIQTADRINPAGTGLNGGLYVTGTRTQLVAITPDTEFDEGRVLNDSDPTKNGYYYRSGAAWVKGRGFPDTYALLTVTGGTANAVQASADAAVNPADIGLFQLTPTATNTGAMTLAVSGATAKPLLAYDGTAMAAGYIQIGAPVLLYDDGAGNYRLFLDHRFQTFAAATAADRVQTGVDRAAAEAAALAAMSVSDAFARPASRAALKALDTTVVTAAFLTEAGREGPFVWKSGNYSTQIAADTLEGIYVKATAIAGTAGAWQRVRDGDYLASWFGLLADNSTDNTTANLAMLATVYALGGGVMRYSSGVYRFSGTPFSMPGPGLSVIGSGQTATTFRSTSATANVVDFNGHSDLVFESFTMDTSVTRTGGRYFLLDGGYLRCHVSKLHLVSPYIGFEGSGGQSTFKQIKISNVIQYGIDLSGGGAELMWEDVFIVNDAASVTATGVKLRSGVAGPRFFRVITSKMNVGFDIRTTSSALLDGVWFNTCDGDGCSSNGWLIGSADGGNGLVDDIILTNCLGAACGGSGFVIGTYALSVVITNGNITNNVQHGVNITGGGSIVLTNNLIINNNSGGGAFDGVCVNGSVANFSVTGNEIRSGVIGFPGGTHRYGISVGAGSHSYILGQNRIQGYSTAAVLDSGSAPKLVSNLSV